jgi:hypothetical protein
MIIKDWIDKKDISAVFSLLSGERLKGMKIPQIRIPEEGNRVNKEHR